MLGKIARGYFNVSMFIFICGILLMGVGFFSTHEELTTVNSVSQVRNNLGERVQISTTYARYADINVNYSFCTSRAAEAGRLRFLSRGGLGRESLYFLEFRDGIVMMRGGHKFNESFIDTHEYISGRVLEILEDDVSRKLLFRYAENLEYTLGKEIGLYVRPFSNRIMVQEVGARGSIKEIHPYSVMISFRVSDDEESAADFFYMGFTFTMLGAILLTFYGIVRIITKTTSKKRERMMDENQVF